MASVAVKGFLTAVCCASLPIGLHGRRVRNFDDLKLGGKCEEFPGGAIPRLHHSGCKCSNGTVLVGTGCGPLHLKRKFPARIISDLQDCMCKKPECNDVIAGSGFNGETCKCLNKDGEGGTFNDQTFNSYAMFKCEGYDYYEKKVNKLETTLCMHNPRKYCFRGVPRISIGAVRFDPMDILASHHLDLYPRGACHCY
mmetsp:Transcript_93772/g.185968  ORF Transcript_93772/g.185968 Transcript_93772/m.185968 type:complete len:197 (+) Transcript_93772:52-642(+)